MSKIFDIETMSDLDYLMSNIFDIVVNHDAPVIGIVAHIAIALRTRPEKQDERDLGAFALAEVVRLSSQLYYYRFG